MEGVAARRDVGYRETAVISCLGEVGSGECDDIAGHAWVDVAVDGEDAFVLEGLGFGLAAAVDAGVEGAVWGFGEDVVAEGVVVGEVDFAAGGEGADAWVEFASF